MCKSRKVVGFIGLGVMGEPMCRHLAKKADATVVAYDISAAALQRLAADGAKTAPSIASIGTDADIVFMSLPSGDIVSEVVRGAKGLLSVARRDQVIVDLGTSPVDLMRQLAKEFAEKGVHFLDSPVMRTRSAAIAGTLFTAVGGDRQIFEEVRPLLSTFASDITYCGGVGCGQIVKILNNMVLFESGVALSEAYAIGSAAGMDPKLLFEALSQGSCDSVALRNQGLKSIVPRDFPAPAFSVIYASKDLRYALELAEQTGVDATGARSVAEWFKRSVEAGDGDRHWTVISRQMIGKGAGKSA
jgi:3-hydroxyisobutyrate dehydrogenase-like beta-hydroxyacid dehydrogenase